MTRTIYEACVDLRAGRVTSAQLTVECLRNVHSLNSKLFALPTLTQELALTQARRADAALNHGIDLGPLHGIPIAIKDIIDVEGIATKAQSAQRQPSPALRHAEVVEKLVAGGAVIIGKTTTHEFAFGTPELEYRDPPARNPWNSSRFSGGSSSGNAVAVATGMALGAIGTDTAGSIRSPSALCGIVGYKPARSVISRKGVIPLAPSMDTVGVMAATARDCAVMMQAITGQSSFSPSIPSSVLASRRVAWVKHFYTRDVEAAPETIAAIDSLIKKLRQHNVTVVEVEVAPLQDWNAVGLTVHLAETFRVHREALLETPERFGNSLRNGLLLGAAISEIEFERAVLMRESLRWQMDEVFRSYDFLITGIQLGPAPPLAGIDPWSFIKQLTLGVAFNLCDLPAIAIRTGWSEGGLPLSAQIVAPRNDGDKLLDFAGVVELMLNCPSKPLL